MSDRQLTEDGRIARTIDAMYQMVSGPAGRRDWSILQTIFHEDARLMRTSVDGGAVPSINIMSRAAYVRDVTQFLDTTDFYETETARRIDVFGNIAQVWSAYEARNDPHDETPERRGINSIQLHRDGTGVWRVISMLWDNERR